MRGSRWWAWPAVLALALVGAQAAADEGATAPERTVASAQEFLRHTLPGSDYVSTPMSEMLAKARGEQLRARFEWLPIVFDADPVAECVSMLQADALPTLFVVENPRDPHDASDAALEDLLGGSVLGDPDGMHFGTIRALRLVGSEVRMRFAGNTEDAVLHLDSAETAARVHDALDFLRVQCDATRATGF